MPSFSCYYLQYISSGGTCWLNQVTHATLNTIIGIQDLIILINIILANEYSSLADINGDGTINVQDIIMLIDWILDGDIPINRLNQSNIN